MNKVKTAMMLSAATVANVTALGFLASPASASTHERIGTAGGPTSRTVSSTGRSRPNPVNKKLSLAKLRHAEPAARAAAADAKSYGFVPRSKPGVIPDTETGCNSTGVVCLGLYGGGNFVSRVNESWTTGTGCHIGHIAWATPSGLSASYPSSGFICRNQEYSVFFEENFPTGTAFCGSFNNIPGVKCWKVQ